MFLNLRTMLRLNSISLVQFRNYLQQEFVFSQRIIGICGRNGTGKTNLLDAIYYQSFAKSYFSRHDGQNVHHGTMGMRIHSKYTLHDQPEELVCILRENLKKEVLWNSEPYKKLSDHIGRIPAVMIAPDDVSLISGGSEERRKFLDTILSQINPAYLQSLIAYNKLLQQRNSLLKQAAESKAMDDALLEVLSTQLIEKGNELFQVRKKFLTHFLVQVGAIYARIAGKEEGLQLAYESQLLHTEFAELLDRSRHKDLAMQRTTVGIHRDDLGFFMDTAPFKIEASQGQRKSLLFALKLAEWQVLKKEKGFTPILLLDDVFEKLDEQRMSELLQWVCTESDGQVFITDTHEDRLQMQLQQTGTAFQLLPLTHS